MSAPPRRTLLFSKIVGTGNDFLFVDARKPLEKPFGEIPRNKLVKEMCDRHTGAGADGFVFIERGPSESQLKWDFYNSDGSGAEMCGNASRCVGRWAHHYLGLNSVELETVSGQVRIDATPDLVTSDLNYVKIKFEELNYQAGGKTCYAMLVNTGVPHAVVEIEKIEDAYLLQDDIRALRFHPLTGAKGANVTFLALNENKDDRPSFSTVTYERGVEGFTLSCGTGVLAAAALGLQKHRGLEAVVTTPGGQLHVQFGEGLSGARLTGPADFLFEAQLPEEFVK